MRKQSNLNLLTILLFFIILLLSVYAVLSQESNLTDNSLIIIDNDSHQENNTPLVGDVILNTDITTEKSIGLKLNETINQSNTINQTNLSTNESSNMTVFEENTLLEKTDVIKKILDNDKVTSATKELLKSSSEDDSEEFIIKYDAEFSKSQLEKFSKVKSIPELGVSKFKANIKDLEEILDDDSVEYIEIDQKLNLLEDTISWNVEQVGAASVWNYSSGDGVKVAILDTGIGEHDDLLIAGGWNVMDNSSDYVDTQGHGTAVAGVLGAVMNDEGLIGVSPESSIYAVKIMNSGSGQLSDAIAGVQWAIDNNMNIISMSFGFDGYSQIFKEALQDAYNHGILIVGASGNDGTEGVDYPAAYDTVIAIGATDENNDRASFSNYGSELELMAPGVDINSTSLNDGYSTVSGTSLAAPHVAGVAAIIWSYNQSLSNEEVRAKLRNDALDLGATGKDDYYGYGLVLVNLSAENYNYTPLSYYYEIFNISDYELENESYSFWLSGNGTIDDVNFSEGYYLINKTINGTVISQKIFVNENGTIILLSVTINPLDDWTVDGGSATDRLIWAENSHYINMKTETTTHDVECWEYDYTGSGYYDECYFRDSTAYSNCGDYCGGSTSCYTGSSYIGDYHEVVNDVSKRSGTAEVATFEGDSYCTTLGVGTKTYWVIDQKRNVCITEGGNDYKFQGNYNADSWRSYSETYYCPSGSGCDFEKDMQTCNTETCIPQSPCRRLEGYSCNISNSNVTDDCLTGLNCTSNVCVNQNETTDLEVLDVVIIQTVKNVPMILQKTGVIRVRVRNNGNLPVTIARVNLTAPSLEVNGLDYKENSIEVGETVNFDWWFKPIQTGTNINISASVEIVE
ncbi:MAG: S8 family peptidase [archaeon]